MRKVTFAELPGLAGEELGVSRWFEVDQARIDRFAEATGDFQWIHVDTARAAAELPGGRTIAHGYLTLSLVPLMVHDAYHLEGVGRGLNYGLNRVRFPAPVPAGSRLRGRYRLKSAESTKDGGLRLHGEVTVELEGSSRPACVAETIAVFYPADNA
jgi:acyl dehydratase